jgi:Tol biopolymer transport system component
VFDRSRSLRALATIGAVALAATMALPGIAEAAAKTVLISKSGSGAIGNSESGEPSISKTGRYIAFQSGASNLVPGDTNGAHDCFVRDHRTDSIERVSVASDGEQSNGDCWGPAISADGRFVAFYSSASNLVPGDTNSTRDVFVHDRQLGTTERVSVGPEGRQANGISEDPAISADGRLIAFESKASNLVAGDTNDRQDVFVHDRTTGTTTRVSVSSKGAQAVGGDSRDPDLSPDGRFVVFDSAASNLVPNDTNRKRDIFIRDLVTNKTQRVSVNSGGKQGNGDSGNPVVSASGRFVAFDSKAKSLVKGDTNGTPDVFVRDRKKGTTTRVSVSSAGKQGTDSSSDPTISDNGRYITFESYAPNLVPKDRNGRWDVFLRDRVNKKTSIVSLTASGGRTSNGDSDDPAISGDARFIVFESTAPNIVKGDTNRAEDVFRRGPLR